MNEEGFYLAVRFVRSTHCSTHGYEPTHLANKLSYCIAARRIPRPNSFYRCALIGSIVQVHMYASPINMGANFLLGGAGGKPVYRKRDADLSTVHLECCPVKGTFMNQWPISTV
jgi:hypothetical protein